jgi:hypothetical protein
MLKRIEKALIRHRLGAQPQRPIQNFDLSPKPLALAAAAAC